MPNLYDFLSSAQVSIDIIKMPESFLQQKSIGKVIHTTLVTMSKPSDQNKLM